MDILIPELLLLFIEFYSESQRTEYWWLWDVYFGDYILKLLGLIYAQG